MRLKGHSDAELLAAGAGEPGRIMKAEGRSIPLNHPNGATGYRIDHAGKSICYITDTEHREGERDPAIVE